MRSDFYSFISSSNDFNQFKSFLLRYASRVNSGFATAPGAFRSDGHDSCGKVEGPGERRQVLRSEYPDVMYRCFGTASYCIPVTYEVLTSYIFCVGTGCGGKHRRINRWRTSFFLVFCFWKITRQQQQLLLLYHCIPLVWFPSEFRRPFFRCYSSHFS